MRNMPKLKRVLVPSKRRPDRSVHGMDVGFVDLHALAGEVGAVVDWDGVEVGVFGPVFVED